MLYSCNHKATVGVKGLNSCKLQWYNINSNPCTGICDEADCECAMTSVRNDYDCALLRLLMLTLQGVHVTLTVRLGDYVQKLDSFFLQFSLVCLPHGVQYCNALRCHPTACDAIHLRCYDAVRLSHRWWICHSNWQYSTSVGIVHNGDSWGKFSIFNQYISYS